jgi:hypothetical protein
LHATKQTVPLRFITLTVKTLPDRHLDEGLQKLTTAWQKLRRMKSWKATQHGGAAILELRYYPDRRRWHPHLHIVGEGLFLHHDVLRHMWLLATGDSDIIDIRTANRPDQAAQYLTSYVTKPIHADILRDPEKLREAINGLHGRKLISTYGTWLKISMTRRPDPDGDEWEAIAPLEELVGRASEGDAFAQFVIAALNQDTSDAPPDDRHDLSDADPPNNA